MRHIIKTIDARNQRNCPKPVKAPCRKVLKVFYCIGGMGIGDVKGEGEGETRLPSKNSGNIFSRNYYVKFGHF